MKINLKMQEKLSIFYLFCIFAAEWFVSLPNENVILQIFCPYFVSSGGLG